MARTDATTVQEVLLQDYDSARAPSLDVFIRAATALVDRIETCSSEQGTPLSEEEKILLETYLAAHLYASTDRIYTAKTTGRASASFAGTFADKLNMTPYGQMAQVLDVSGCLRKVTAPVAGGVWLGKPPSEQIIVTDRD